MEHAQVLNLPLGPIPERVLSGNETSWQLDCSDSCDMLCFKYIISLQTVQCYIPYQDHNVHTVISNL